jgi:hypothetical protein
VTPTASIPVLPPAQQANVAPVIPIRLAGEERTLKYGFRAYKYLGLNPFDEKSLAEFQSREMTIDFLVSYLYAGLLHEHEKDGPRFDHQPTTEDEILGALDMFTFVDLWLSIQRAMGVDKEAGDPGEKQPGGEAKTANPPQA